MTDDLPTFGRMADGRAVFRGTVSGRPRVFVSDTVRGICEAIALEVLEPGKLAAKMIAAFDRDAA